MCRRAAVAAIPILEAAGDEAGLARAWQLSGDVHWSACRWGERAVALERALTYAQQAGDAHEAAHHHALARARYCLRLHTGRERHRALRRNCSNTPPARYAEAAVNVALAVLHAMATRFEQARGLYAEARATRRGDRQPLRRRRPLLHGAMIAILAGDQRHRRARTPSRHTKSLREMGEQSFLSTVAGLLGRVLYDLQRFADADEMTTYAQQITPPTTSPRSSSGSATRAKLLARSGDHQQAIRLGRVGARARGSHRRNSTSTHANACSTSPRCCASAVASTRRPRRRARSAACTRQRETSPAQRSRARSTRNSYPPSASAATRLWDFRSRQYGTSQKHSLDRKRRSARGR